MESTSAKRSRTAGWLVHMYTAGGAVLAFAGAWAVVHGYDRLALASMFLATIVDATDGSLARLVDVRRVLPEIDGSRIDDIVDYITFVFLPLMLLEASGGLYRWAVFPVAAVVLVSSMYGFVAPDAKSNLGQEIIDLRLRRPYFERRIDEAGRPHNLLDDLPRVRALVLCGCG